MIVRGRATTLLAHARNVRQPVCNIESLFRFHSCRYLATHATDSYGAVVAGAGPAGLAVVGTLLENRVPGKVLWVDPSFQAGDLGREWREVPSNTKVNLFLAFAEAVKSFRDITERTPKPNAITALQDLPQDQGCSISKAADMVEMLTSGLRQSGEVEFLQGRVAQANWEGESASWIIENRVGSSQSAKLQTLPSSRLVLCTGSHPNEVQIPISGLEMDNIDLYAALKPSVLAKSIPAETRQTVAVVGSSHSAILCLLNLFNLARSTHPHVRVKWFSRGKLTYAVPKEGWILRDNTGLKGIAADFARDNLEDSKLASSEVGKIITKHALRPGQEKKVYTSELPDCRYIIRATGFAKNSLPTLSRDGRRIQDAVYESSTGGFVDGSGSKIPQLYGAGIAFPEQVTDPEGNVEHAVGLWKFMKYLKRVGGQWAA